jgi:hypothetical protein
MGVFIAMLYQKLATKSYEDVLMNEIVSYENMFGINILTDARHDTRKNYMFSDVVCIGANTIVMEKKKKCYNASKISKQKYQNIFKFYSICFIIPFCQHLTDS